MWKKIALLIIALIIGITTVMVIGLSRLSFDYDFEKFFPEGDPDTEYFNAFRKKFETDNDFVLVGIVNEKGIFEKDFLIKCDSLTKQLGRIKNITRSLSITNFEEPIYVEFTGGYFIRKYLHLEQDSLLDEDAKKIMQSDFLVNTFVSYDEKALSIYLKTTPYLSKAGSDSLAKDINSLLEKYSFDEIHVAGRSTGQSYYVKLMQSELALFIATSFILVILFLSISFRTIWGVVIPILVVVFSIIWTLGTMAWLNQGISLVQTVLPTILFVVGMSDSVHLIAKYLEELRQQPNDSGEKEKQNALLKAFKEVSSATFLTSLTTAIGFITLMFIPIEPVREFGQFTSLGILFAYVLSFTLLPSVLMLMPRPKISSQNEKNNFWPKILHRSFMKLIRYRKRSIVFFMILGIGAGIVATQLKFNNYLVEDLRDSDPMKKNFDFFEKKFSGVRPFEMGIQLKKGETIFNLNILKETESLENYLHENYGVGFIVSPVTVIKSINKAYHTGNKDFYKLPKSDKELEILLQKINKYDTLEMMQAVMTKNGNEFRISGKTADLGSAVYRIKNHDLNEYFLKSDLGKHAQHRLTGTAFLIDKNNIYLAKNLVIGLLISLFVISLITFVLFRFDFRIILVALLPNLFPIFLIGMIMVLAGINLKVSTSMIFAISFGIAVDDTIHFLSRLRQELNKGKSLNYAIKRTYISTGKAIIITTIILSGGFMTLIFSHFLGTFYIGFLIGLTLIFAVIFDLLFLPPLLWWLMKK